ncbi:LexA family protein [Veillonella magna]|uniref:LexA family protein n=1 Tax=Veillonella magna TaxID=464322 RepID=UPI0023F3F0BB|nr:XRE family transcriptional regulator [Veillonella magna]
MAKASSRLKTPPTSKQIEIANRLRFLRIEKKLSLQEVADFIKVSKVTLSRYETLDIVNIPSDKIELLAKKYSVTPAYIMGWEDKTNSKNCINFIKSSDTSMYPYVPYSVSAGELTSISAISELPQIALPDAMLGKYAHKKDLIFMTINGESMNQVIDNGAMIAIKTDIEIDGLHDGDIVVVTSEGNYTVKRFYNDKINKRYIFRPDSSCPEFTDIIFNYDNCNDLQLIGKVVMYNVFL